MTQPTLAPGLIFTRHLKVDDSLTVPQLSPAFTGFEQMPPVFATAYLVGFVEWTCIDGLTPYLSAEQQTVGTQVNLSHSAATPVGMQVTAEVELIEVADKKLRFKVICRDEKDIISEGTHERFIVDKNRFLERLARKQSQA